MYFSVELFERTCDDAYEWMLEKLEKIETDDLGRDLKTVQALQRKHQVNFACFNASKAFLFHETWAVIMLTIKGETLN